MKSHNKRLTIFKFPFCIRLEIYMVRNMSKMKKIKQFSTFQYYQKVFTISIFFYRYHINTYIISLIFDMCLQIFVLSF